MEQENIVQGKNPVIKKLFQIPATITKITTLSDNTLNITLNCQELTNRDEEAKVFQLRNKLGWFLFSESVIKEMDIPQEKVEFDNQKSLSQRLYNVLFVLHKEKGGKPEDFEDWRRKYMETIINQIKIKIDECKQG